ncbi:DNA repair protein RecN [Arthrobacter sp. Hiyo1]|nr:DNA repair protein RecN [Arthrobacter sp. Hiyo1]
MVSCPRVMLAIEVVLAAVDPVPTFVFDEVDAGVGGRAAVEIGRRLAMLARHVQVLVVTHLPQVAAFADQHIRVTKTSVRGSDGKTASGFTSSDVQLLDDEERVKELAGCSRGRKTRSLRARMPRSCWTTPNCCPSRHRSPAAAWNIGHMRAFVGLGDRFGGPGAGRRIPSRPACFYRSGWTLLLILAPRQGTIEHLGKRQSGSFGGAIDDRLEFRGAAIKFPCKFPVPGLVQDDQTHLCHWRCGVLAR